MAKKNVAVEETVEEVKEEIKEEAVEEIEEVVETVAKKPKEKEYIVKTPVKNFSGVVAGVHFAYGEAKVKAGWILNWFKENGYIVEEVK